MAEDVKIVISAIDKTKKTFNVVTLGLKAVSKAAFSMKGALIAAAGPAAIGYLIKQSIEATDSLEKTASKIGTTTEALSALRFAADLSGVATNTVDMAMQRFTRRLSEAARGTGEAKGALKELNVDARQLQRIPLDEQMLELSEAFSQVTSEADKVRLAFKLFDSEGVSLVNTLSLGADNMRELFKEAKTLGIVMSSSAAAGVASANDALTKLFSLLRGIRDQIVAALAPAIEHLATLLKERIIAGIQAANGSIEEFANKTIRNMIVALGNLVIGFGETVGAVMGFANAVANTFNEVKKYFDESHVYMENPFGTEMQEKILSAGRAIVQFGESSSFAFGKARELGEQGENQISVFSRWSDALKKTTDEMGDIDEGMKAVADNAAGALTDSLTAAISGAKDFKDAIKDMAKSVIDSLIKMMVQYWIVKPMFDALGTALGMPTSTTGKAIGGSVQAGQPYMVGERGPEMFVPNQSGSIVPNDKMGGGGGGVVVNQTINVSTGVSQTVRAEIANLMPQIAGAAKSAVADGRARGGSFGKALGA